MPFPGLLVSSSPAVAMPLAVESPDEKNKKRFALHDGKIVYQLIRKEESSKQDDNNDWFGCNFCNRWLGSMSRLEEHYEREHDEAESYQFELLELKNCVIQLPYILSAAFSPNTSVKGDAENLNVQLSALTISTQNTGRTEITSMKKAIRRAIKVTQINGNGSSYKKIKAHLVNKVGMDAAKLDRKLRKILERYVEYNKLERHYKKGKTLYFLPSHSKTRSSQSGKDGYKMPKEETRRFRDQQLKLIAKSLRPHGLLPHE